MRPGSIVLALRFSVVVKFNMAFHDMIRDIGAREKKSCPILNVQNVQHINYYVGPGPCTPEKILEFLHLHCHFLRSHAATDLLKNSL